ncbi:endonuclease/exonuclease/phosphatase family protein [Antrihabitans spumae]|jgi:endonuclease/exonuclease/phosphatase (EEP) superfamily protein YafD|uniref:Endonuclease/exonuclease/phosphatase family protein n=1 Tax=Antrihabitans spumae TaxID=3373370 RepID=A0ABW7JKQ3_9NOCA
MGTRWGRRVVIGLGWIAVAIGAFGVALHWLDSSRRFFVLLASFAPYVMIAAVLGLLLLALAKHWIGVGAAVLAIGAAVATQLPVYVASGTPGTGQALTIMQSNIYFGEGDAAAVVREVTANDVDILTIDELTPDSVARLDAAGIAAVLPHRYVEADIGAEGTGIFSRFPLSDQVNHDGFILNQVSARATLPSGDEVTVFAFHPVPPFPSGPQPWSGEMERIRDILDAVPDSTEHVVVGADFNATQDHSLFRKLFDTGIEDSADQVGAGMLRTYPSDKSFPPIIGIDHILLAGAHADELRTVHIEGTDHMAVIADIRLR